MPRLSTLRWTIPVLLALSGLAQASPRALIVVAGQAGNSARLLQGASEDLTLAQEVAQRLGFTAQQVKTLSGSTVSKTSVMGGTKQWLVEGVTAQDRLFMYWSGFAAQTIKNGVCQTQLLLPQKDSSVSVTELLDTLKTTAGTEVLTLFDLHLLQSNCTPQGTEQKLSAAHPLKSKLIQWWFIGREQDNDRSALGGAFSSAIHDVLVNTSTDIALKDLGTVVTTQMVEAGGPKYPAYVSFPTQWSVCPVARFGTFGQGCSQGIKPADLLALALQHCTLTVKVPEPNRQADLNIIIPFLATPPMTGYLYLVEQDPNGAINLTIPTEYLQKNAVTRDSPFNFELLTAEPRGKSTFRLFVTTQSLSNWQIDLNDPKTMTAFLNQVGLKNSPQLCATQKLEIDVR